MTDDRRALAHGVISYNSGPAAPIFDEFDAEVEFSRGSWAAVDGKVIKAVQKEVRGGY